MQVRAELPKDQPAVHALNESACKRPAEADLVDALREKARSATMPRSGMSSDPFRQAKLRPAAGPACNRRCKP